MVRIPTHGPPVHPGEVLLEEFLVPNGISQHKLAEMIGVTVNRVNEIVRGSGLSVLTRPSGLRRCSVRVRSSGSICSSRGTCTTRSMHPTSPRSGRGSSAWPPQPTASRFARAPEQAHTCVRRCRHRALLAVPLSLLPLHRDVVGRVRLTARETPRDLGPVAGHHAARARAAVLRAEPRCA